MHVPEEYDEIMNMLDKFISINELDHVTVASLIQGSIDFEELDCPSASIAIINRKEHSKSVSIKTRNIKINLWYALETILDFEMVLEMRGVWLILAVLKTIIHFVKSITLTLSEYDAIVLFAVYSLRKANYKRIRDFINAERIIEQVSVSDKEISNALDNLEQIGAISAEDGNYILNDVVVVRDG